MALTDAEKQKDYRERKKQGKKEIRGIYSCPQLEIKIKKAVKKIIDNHDKGE